MMFPGMYSDPGYGFSPTYAPAPRPQPVYQPAPRPAPRPIAVAPTPRPNPVAVRPTPPPAPVGGGGQVVTAGPAIAALAPPAASPAGTSTPSAAVELPKGNVVKSPMVGTFYRAPSPGANPFHAVVGYVDAVTVLQNPTLYSSERRGILIEDAAPAVVPFMRAMLPVLDPPAHTALRSALQPPLLGGHVARFREQLATLCGEVVDRALDAGEIDFVHSVAAEIPLLSFSLLMGLDRGEIEPLRAPSDAIIENGINESIPQVEQLCARLDALVVERQRRPRDDYLSQIARLDLAARPLERTERNGLLLQLVICVH